MTTHKQKFWIVVVLLTIISGTVNGQTNVSGGIYTNTTWTKANSPYIVTDTVVVFPGVILTIEPGVEVRFENNKGLEIRRAGIIAMGTITDSISFTSNSNTPTSGIWSAIWINYGIPNYVFRFNYCNIRYADVGISFCCSYDSLIVTNSNFDFNGKGIEATTSYGGISIDSCKFFNNGNGLTGIYEANVENCFFSNNSIGLARLHYSVMDNCTFINNQFGITELAKSSIINSVFAHNQTGIKGGDDCNIQYSVIDSNSLFGIDFSDDNGGDFIAYCQIRHNGTGVNDVNYDAFMTASTFTNNIIENNTTGIILFSGTHVLNNSIQNNSTGINFSGWGNITQNSICHNLIYDIQHNSAANRNIANNCWCTADSANISAKIYDGYDNISLGLLNFLPIDTTLCILSSCQLAVSVNAINPIYCYGDSSGSIAAIPLRGTPPFTFSWSNGLNTDTISGLTSGTYSVTVIDSSGCTVNNSLLLPDGLVLNINSTATSATCDTCHNGSATVHITNGTTPYIYTWNTFPIQITQTATSLQSGSYTVCVRDVNGCVACDSVFVDSTNCVNLSITTQSVSASCSTCTDGTAWTFVTGGTPPYNYTWYTNPIQTNDTATSLLQGTYVVCTNDLYGCTVCDTVAVSTGNCSAFFDLYPDTIPHYYFAVNRASGILPITYSWDWGDGSFDTVPFPTHTYNGAGFYTICLSIIDSVGCSDTHCTSYYLLKTSNEIIQVSVVPELLTGINENSDIGSVLVYPNPASNIITVELSKQASNADISVFNILGQLELSSRTASQKIHTDITELARGVYVLEVRTNRMISRQKFIKE